MGPPGFSPRGGGGGGFRGKLRYGTGTYRFVTWVLYGRYLLTWL